MITLMESIDAQVEEPISTLPLQAGSSARLWPSRSATGLLDHDFTGADLTVTAFACLRPRSQRRVSVLVCWIGRSGSTVWSIAPSAPSLLHYSF